MSRCFKPALFIKPSKRNISFLRIRNFGRSLEMSQLKIDSNFYNFLGYLLSFLAFVLKLLNASYKHYPCGMLALKLPPSTQHQRVPLCWPFLPAWRKSSPLSRSLVCIPVDIHTHPQLQRNVSYFWAPKVIQTSSLFLVLSFLLDHCVFSVSAELSCVLIYSHSLLLHLFRRSTCSQ